MARKVWFQCHGCARKQRLPDDRSHWCDCYKTAPFRMIPVSITRTVNRILRGRRPAERRAP